MSRETDLAWAAGIIDGEGHIGLYLSRTNTGNCYVLKVAVVNTNLKMLERLKSIFNGGSINVRIKKQSHHKQQWCYYACSKKAERVLQSVLPYLVAKSDQAELGLLSRKYIRQHGINTMNPEMEKQSEISARLKELH